jgi:hypothetical protein
MVCSYGVDPRGPTTRQESHADLDLRAGHATFDFGPNNDLFQQQQRRPIGLTRPDKHRHVHHVSSGNSIQIAGPPRTLAGSGLLVVARMVRLSDCHHSGRPERCVDGLYSLVGCKHSSGFDWGTDNNAADLVTRHLRKRL